MATLKGTKTDEVDLCSEMICSRALPLDCQPAVAAVLATMTLLGSTCLDLASLAVDTRTAEVTGVLLAAIGP